MTESTTDAPRSFHDLGIDPKILDALERLQFKTPTPIQQQAIPVGLEGQDIIGIAQTGTGKTLAFGIPMLQRFVQSGKRCGRGLIILPTRELALQVDEALMSLGRQFGLKTAVLIGGAPMRPQQAALAGNPDMIIATPGRLIDHLQQRTLDLRSADVLVLDEADRMLDMGFAPQIKQILRAVPAERQTMLFSATMPDAIVKMANEYMQHPVRVEVARQGTAAERVTHELFIVPQEEKNELLAKVLYEYQGTVLVFTRTRSRASRITRFVRGLGVSAAEIHADRTLIQRRAALDGFKAGTYRVLIATDIAARGIDVSDIELVLNYDLPDNPDDYVHRIGRTGRAGQAGHAISFVAPDQANDVRDIEKLMQSQLEISEHSEHSYDMPRHGTGRGSASRSSRPAPRRSAPPAPRPSSNQETGGPSRSAASSSGQGSGATPSNRRPVSQGRKFSGGRVSSPGRPSRDR